MDKPIFTYNKKYPSVNDLKSRAKKRIPKFAFDYLEGGCNEELNLRVNEEDLQQIKLMPSYLKSHSGVDMRVELFGQIYDAPFGISPIGLQGLMWPKSPEILARAAVAENIPFVLSTVSTSSIETIAKITNGKFWFQLYHPTKQEVLDDILNRLERAQCKVLVVLIDVPVFGLRYKEIKAGLSMPPKNNIRNYLQAVTRPLWSIQTLKAGIPSFASLSPYMDKNMDIKQLGKFMDSTFTGRVDIDKLNYIRQKWKGTLVVKGVVNEVDADLCARIGVDGVIVSNHGGRQIDVGESTISSLQRLRAKYKNKFTIMIDSGLRSGPDIARALACGADFTFMGRPFMYGVGALGDTGGTHTIRMLKAQFYQTMQQLSCEKNKDLPATLIMSGSKSL
ncbi:alpha-hydroxy acid oxidase [Sphingobacterium yanglingense]|uniref:L-lactate dehydrogenase (Cytochrome) n=1 Tax=Sphingobacterium yanglingense TaxID=1437280 RepID=A0A4R6WMZ8_9SPHI|nr:alpha-hydroxy acid oxidase [Sphingobacterium yanglingense]TDQ80162.1 L-lactate dehydrogenase (cytochrome) [Sphingobacterium yanglingense]